MSLVVQVCLVDDRAPGGARAVMDALARGYERHGHQVVQVVPGPDRVSSLFDSGRRETVPAPLLPGGRRSVAALGEVRRLVHLAGPDRLEVHDRSGVRAVRLGRWARELRMPAMLVSHERLDRVLLARSGGLAGLFGARLEASVDRTDQALAAEYDRVVCTSDWAAEEYRRLGLDVAVVPLGVDLEEYRPDRASPRVRETLAPRGEALLVTVTALRQEDRADLAVDCVAELVRRGRRVRLLVVGQGPQGRRLERRAQGLPVRFLGHLDDRHRMATLLACADVALSPGPDDAFGLTALQALACGTPVVVNADSALPGVIGTGVVGAAALAAAGGPEAFADCVEGLLDGPGDQRRTARARAERRGWDATVQGFLAEHRLPYRAATGASH